MQYIPIITLVLVVILLGLVIVLLTLAGKADLPQQIDPTASITALGTLCDAKPARRPRSAEQSAFRDGQKALETR